MRLGQRHGAVISRILNSIIINHKGLKSVKTVCAVWRRRRFGTSAGRGVFLEVRKGQSGGLSSDLFIWKSDDCVFFLIYFYKRSQSNNIVWSLCFLKRRLSRLLVFCCLFPNWKKRWRVSVVLLSFSLLSTRWKVTALHSQHTRISPADPRPALLSSMILFRFVLLQNRSQVYGRKSYDSMGRHALHLPLSVPFHRHLFFNGRRTPQCFIQLFSLCIPPTTERAINSSGFFFFFL